MSAGALDRQRPDTLPLQQATSTTRHLDGLRIIAACAVVVLHYSDYLKDRPAGRFMVDHTWHFNLFVDLFFVVSGFVIARQYLEFLKTPAMQELLRGYGFSVPSSASKTQ